ncbi:MAG: cation transporter [Herminiimonas sp.]|nr:cation transporter [Herminiimonas sp.]
MSDCCSGGCASDKPPVDTKYRLILWIALVVNLSMFGVEIISGWRSGSSALLADAVDFMGDSLNYLTSLVVLGMPLLWRSRTALVKGATMGAYGLFVLGATAWHFATATVPKAETMGAVALLAFAANGVVALLLFAYRNGDSNMRAVWLCTRNDVIGNFAVMLAALGVAGTGSGWPDIAVASVMGVLGLTAARSVIVHARTELAAATPSTDRPLTVEFKRR